jgi:hypothetical protein
VSGRYKYARLADNSEDLLCVYVIFDLIAESVCGCNVSAEYVCLESFRERCMEYLVSSKLDRVVSLDRDL